MIPAMVFTNQLFPVHGADLGLVDRAEQRAAGCAPVVAKSLRMGGENNIYIDPTRVINYDAIFVK